MNRWEVIRSIKIHRILHVTLLISALAPLMTVIFVMPPLVNSEAFDRALVKGILVALLVSWLLSVLVADVLFGRMIKQIQDFCEQVKHGKYDGFGHLPNQGWDNEDENELLILMRKMNWMAHLIKTRETELQQTISKLCIAQDELEVKNDCLLEMAMKDPLTHLYNRRYFFEHLEREHDCRRRPIYDLALLMLDIDHFKQINDTYGHQTGDAVLVELALIIKQTIRKSDFCARVGGEEFAVLLPNIKKQDALLIACRIRCEIEKHAFHDSAGNGFCVTCSLGVVIETDSVLGDKNALYKSADVAMYAAKELGRNKVCCCNEIGIPEQILEDELMRFEMGEYKKD